MIPSDEMENSNDHDLKNDVYNDHYDMLQNKLFGETISTAYKLASLQSNGEIDGIDMSTTSFSVQLEHNQMKNIRNEFYLKIINNLNARQLLVRKVKSIILGLEASGDLKRYEPTEQNPIYVFKDNNVVARITKSIATVGFLWWNNIIGDKKAGLSRIQAIIVFMKDNEGKIVMIVLDSWSLRGTSLLSKEGLVTEHSSKNDRKILINILDDYAIVEFSKEKYVFSSHDSKLCVVCLDNKREIRYDCGHGVVCNECGKGLTACPICRRVLNAQNGELSMCFESYKY